MTRRSLDREDGWVLVTAIILMAIMLSVGLASFAFVDTNQKRARESRERESSLSLAEGALYAQGFALARAWPNATQTPLTADCSSSLTTTRFCPDRDTLAAGSSGNSAVAQFSATDFQANATWTTSVRDNTGVLAAAYDPALANNTLIDPVYGACPTTPCRMDWNRDRQLWVQSSAVVRGRPRNIVARMKLEELRESTPSAGVTAGGINVSNSGNNQMVDATGTNVQLRCSVSSPQCANFQNGQVSPAPVGSTSGIPPLMTAAQLIRFRDRAITDGRYYAGCPTVDATTGQYDLTGTVVWVEHCDSPPNFANNVATVPCAVPPGMKPYCINAPDKPGMLIWHCGRMDFQGNFTFVGILYNANNSDGTCDPAVTKSGDCYAGNQPVGPADAITINGGFGVWGAVAVDGGGCLHVGSNGMQVKFNGNAWDALKSYGTVGLVQNTWRELKAG